MRYLAVDYHKRFSQLCMMDKEGNVIKEGSIFNTKEALNKFLGYSKNGRLQAVLEASRNWTVMYDWLEELTDEVKLAHPLKVKAIAEAKVKTDKIDARTLAHLLRSNLIPEAYVPEKDTRKAKNILRQRMFFIKLRTMIKNRIQMILERHPQLNKPNFSDLFGSQGREWLNSLDLSSPDSKLLKENLKLLDELNQRISSTEYLINLLAKEDSRIQRLQTIPGIGKFFSCLISYEIDRIERFKTPDKLCAYAGLIPSTYASAGKVFHGRIIKQGNKYLRWALIEAVWPAINKDLSLRLYYERMKKTKGSNIAKVACARRLLKIVYRVLSENRDYVMNLPSRPHLSLTDPD